MDNPLLTAIREIIRTEVRREVLLALAEQQPEPRPDEMLTVAAAASHAAVKPATIRDWVRRGRLRAIRIGKPRRRGRTISASIRILRRELDAALRPRVDAREKALSPEARALRDANQLLTRGT